jgi:hypothetical protein
MTNEEFCRLDTQFYGEETNHIKQIALRTFNGEELKEYVEHCIKLKSVVLADVVVSSPNICTDTGEECKYDCSGLCKERC